MGGQLRERLIINRYLFGEDTWYCVLCQIMKEHDVFTLSELRHKLRVRYHLKESSDTLKALKEYLLLLEWFGMIRQQVGY